MTPRERASLHRWEISQRRKQKIYNYNNKQLPNSKMLYTPEILDIYGKDGIDRSLAFIHRLQKYQYNTILDFTLNFRNCKTLKAAALVTIFSIVERIIVDYHKQVKLVLPTQKQAPHILKTLRKSGLIELCREKKVENYFDRNYLPIVSSSGGRFREEIVDFIVKKIYQEMPPSLENIYADAIQEAINNVTAHAYIAENKNIIKRWWLLCDVIGDQLYLVIYDAGIGIPQSLEVHINKNELDFSQPETISELREHYNNFPELNQHSTFEQLLSILNSAKFPEKFPDEQKIYLAMIGNFTRKTGNDELKHGQGSKSIKALVSTNDDGILWIFSGLGRVKFVNDVIKPDLMSLPKHLTGTLIQWNIKVPK